MARKLYPHVIGAYSTPPKLCRADDGRWYAQGEIQQWTGSLADVCAALEIVFEGDIATLRVDAKIADTGNAVILVAMPDSGVDVIEH